MEKKKVIYPHKIKMLNSLIGSALFVALGCWLIYLRNDLPGWQQITVYMAYVLTPLFLWLFLHTAFRFLIPKPILILDEKGLTDQSSTFGVGLIAWQDIKKVFPLSVGKQQFLSIELNNPDAYLKKLKGLKRSIMKMNIQVGHTPVKIPGNVLSMSTSELGDLIKQYL